MLLHAQQLHAAGIPFVFDPARVCHVQRLSLKALRRARYVDHGQHSEGPHAV
jgi:hypothetical protein